MTTPTMGPAPCERFLCGGVTRPSRWVLVSIGGSGGVGRGGVTMGWGGGATGRGGMGAAGALGGAGFWGV